MKETEPMDTYLPDGREAPGRDDPHTDETNLPEREHKHNIPVIEDKRSSEAGKVELVRDKSQTDKQPDVMCLSQPEEDEQNGHAGQVQEESAEDAHREVRRSTREEGKASVHL